MKKILAFILAALMLLPLAACGSNGGKTDPQPDDHQQTTVPDNADSVKSKVEEFCGYSFTFSDKSVRAYNLWLYCNNRELFDFRVL